MDAAAWDDRYRTTEVVWSTTPNRFVVEELTALPPGRALDLACGEGRNAVWLAEQGWQATGVDFSEVGLDKGRRLAAERGVEVTWAAADVTTWDPPRAAFDVVVVAYLQLPAAERRAALTRAVAALAPGGTLLVVAHDSRNLAEGHGGPQRPEVLYGPDDVLSDLRSVAPGLEVQRAETVERPVEGAERPALDCLVRVCLPAD